MPYCTRSDLAQYLLQAYLDKVEQLNPGSIDRHLTQVTAEIDEALRAAGVALPVRNGLATLRRICAVIVCWLAVGEITSLMSTDAGSNNEFLPLQRLHDQARKDLSAIASGERNALFAPDEDGSGVANVEVVAPKPIFGPDTWRKF